MTHDEMIAVIQAHRDGKQIQYWSKDSESWIDMHMHPLWNFCVDKYRVKPKHAEYWVNTYISSCGNEMCIGHKSESIAKNAAKESGPYIRVAVRMREVV